MRIIAGAWRGRPVVAPAGGGTRPTSDRAREGLFSMLVSRIGSFDGLHVVDLFAGSGALGLEALSRGAASCLFVDRDAAAVAAIRRNLDALGAGLRGDVRAASVPRLPPPPRPCDIIFIDPPYDNMAAAEAALALAAAAEWLAPGGIVSLESAAAPPPHPAGIAPLAERRFGKATIRLYRHAP